MDSIECCHILPICLVTPQQLWDTMVDLMLPPQSIHAGRALSHQVFVYRIHAHQVQGASWVGWHGKHAAIGQKSVVASFLPYSQ